MAIRDALLPALHARFPTAFREGSSPGEVAVFPAAHPDFGDVVILDDEHEATVVVGRLTHTHFGPYPTSGKPQEIEASITESVLEFLGDLFADRLVVWCVPGKAAGYHEVGHPRVPVPDEAKVFLWSGPRRK